MMRVAAADMPPRSYDIVCTATVTMDPKSLSGIHMRNNNQFESLLHCDQARDHHIIINDLATCFYDSYGTTEY